MSLRKSDGPTPRRDERNRKLPVLSTIPEIPNGRMSLSLKRRYPFNNSSSSNDSQPNDTVPAFVHIFDPDIDMSGCAPLVQQFHEKPALTALTSGPQLSLQRSLHHQHSSVSTSASSSPNTSPTTTVSTLESSMNDDSTPDSSPESPPSIMTSFKAGVRDGGPPNSRPGSASGRPNSPSKRPRNTKNLSLNVPPPGTSPIGASPRLSEDESRNSTPKSVSAPPSPAFIVPPPPPNPRRRPSHLGLTIKLPATLPDKLAPRTGILRHHQSSPSLLSPSLKGPAGGMTLPQSASFRQTTFQRPSFNMRWASETMSEDSSQQSNSPPKSPEALLEMDEEEDLHEPRSGEPKSPAYPNGPLCIFDPNIYLFSEPDASLASQFDVVINVAREVLNPFKPGGGKPAPAPLLDSVFSPVERKAPEHLAGPVANEPEYIHMPWDHNTAILEDLPKLVELIDERSSAGKRVLVHCQCGVSRSATLLIAYSMYKNPEKTMQDAYSAVKSRSRWIGPNMSLIYQLTDWKKRLTADMPATATWGNRSGGSGPRTGVGKSAPGGFGRGRGLDSDGSEALAEPQTAPLPPLGGFPSSITSPGFPDEKPQVVRARSEAGGYISSISPGPSSAPPGMIGPNGKLIPIDNRQSWPDGDAKFRLPPRQRSPSPAPKAHRLSWQESVPKEPPSPRHYAPPPPPPVHHRGEPFMLGRVGFVVPDRFPPEDETPKITSPRTSGMYGSMPSRRSGGWSLFADPRSPTERITQPPILRNIFDVL